MKKDKISVVERQVKALKLRARGRNYRDIAKELGFAGPSGAYDAIQRALKTIVKEAADEVRDFELQRLDQLLDGVWDKAISGDVKAINTVLNIMDRRAKYLGLNTATMIEEQLTVEYVNNWRGKPEDLDAIQQQPENPELEV